MENSRWLPRQSSPRRQCPPETGALIRPKSEMIKAMRLVYSKGTILRIKHRNLLEKNETLSRLLGAIKRQETSLCAGKQYDHSRRRCDSGYGKHVHTPG